MPCWTTYENWPIWHAKLPANSTRAAMTHKTRRASDA
jgi:hypothetical protein